MPRKAVTKKAAPIQPADAEATPQKAVESAATSHDQRGRPLHDGKHTLLRSSLLAMDGPTVDIRGFFNLFCLLIFVSNFQSVLSNFISYGSMIRIPNGVINWVSHSHALACYLLMHIPMVTAWWIERYFAPLSSKPFSPMTIALQLSNSALLLYIPFYTVKIYKPNVVISTILICFSLVWLFKLLSFHHVCLDVRTALKNRTSNLRDVCWTEQEAEIAGDYPRCLTMLHLYRFLVMPTMCFQFFYPSTNRIRWAFVLRHVFEGLVCTALAKIVIEQYMLVKLRNSFTGINMEEAHFITLFLHFQFITS